MKTLLVLLLVGVLGFGIYKQFLHIKDLRAQNEECERKIGQLEAELNQLKKAAPQSRPFTPNPSALDSPQNGNSAPAPPPANSKQSGDWMWKKTKLDSALEHNR
jgi:hypothetical protein